MNKISKTRILSVKVLVKKGKTKTWYFEMKGKTKAKIIRPRKSQGFSRKGSVGKKEPEN